MTIDNIVYDYKYDNLYNITDIYKNKELINHYEYDSFNELIKEDNYQTNKTIKYTYDTSGNILKREEYEINTDTLIKEDTFVYNNTNWKDQLTKYNDTEITYDAIGNPVTIGDKNLTWNARELQSYQDTMSKIEYFYNKEGIRTRKRVNNVETNYFVENSNIIMEETNGNMLYYMRTGEHELIGVKYNNATYYYQKNYQGDITGIYNEENELIATYEYDSYGKVLSIKDANGNNITDENHIANRNPFRYRSYYYDIETKLYYLNSRYYNPEWGRFLNVDDYIGVAQSHLSCNLYLYTNNNYINALDSTGMFFKKLWNKVTTAVQKVFDTVSTIYNNAKAAVGNFLDKAKETYKNAKEHFVFEVGYGVGAGAKIYDNGVVIAGTSNFSYQNGIITESTSTKAEIEILEYKIGIEGKHIDDGWHDNYFTFFDQNQLNCKNTSISFNTGRDKGNLSLETSNYNSKFFGINIEGYIGVGGYIKIGFQY